MVRRTHPTGTALLRIPRFMLWARAGRVLMHQSLEFSAMEGMEGATRPGPIHGLHLGKGGMFTREVAPFHGGFSFRNN
jgi:hypothetical protein